MSAGSRQSRGSSSRAKVWVRTKPTPRFSPSICLQPDQKTVEIHCARDARMGHVNNQVVDWSFRVDGVLHDSSQEQVFECVASDVVTSALDGYNGTVMCYGQTGAGKTFTMTGATENYQHRGLIPRTLSQIYREIEDRQDRAITVRISFVEIYNETMFDLLGTLPESLKAAQLAPLVIVEDDQGVYVRGLQNHVAHGEEEALNLLFEGETNRTIACHTLNSQSSRSHCIFTLYIESRSRVASNAQYTLSKLNFVDLAGSERLSKTQSEGKTKEEAMHINKSLSFLEHTVLALADKRTTFVPFRQSKLTHFLKDSLGGACCTRLIANIWGDAEQLEESISTLRFATRMMCVPVEPCVNVQYNPTVIVKNLEQEVEALKKELAMHDILANRSQMNYEPLSEQQKSEIRDSVAKYIDNQVDEIDVVSLKQVQAVFEAFRLHARQMVVDAEERLRSRYTLIDRSNAEQIAAAQQAGIPINDRGELVGETEPSGGFGVGPASAAHKLAPSNVIAAKKQQARKGKKDKQSPAAVTTGKSAGSSPGAKGATKSEGSRTPSAEKEEKRDEGGRASQLKDQRPARPSTPPTRVDAFEQFKRDMGSEINRIFTENKDILASKKSDYSRLAKQLNCTKEEIDKSLERLAVMTKEREAEGESVTEEGDTIISEAEYLEITRLKDLKAVYRTHLDELKAVKAEVQYCQKLVDQCRQRLVREFDGWFAENFLFQDPNVAGASASQGQLDMQPTKESNYMYEDEQERYERQQLDLLMAKDPQAVPFMNAHMRTQRRKIYTEAEAQFNPSLRKVSGSLKRTLRRSPPTSLEIHP